MQIYAQMRETKKFYRPGSKRSKEFILARTMMALVLVFLVLNTPRLILGLIEVEDFFLLNWINIKIICFYRKKFY